MGGGSADLSFLRSYDAVMANSDFTRGWINELWKIDAEVLFPPIQVQRLHPVVHQLVDDERVAREHQNDLLDQGEATSRAPGKAWERGERCSYQATERKPLMMEPGRSESCPVKAGHPPEASLAWTFRKGACEA